MAAGDTESLVVIKGREATLKAIFTQPPFSSDITVTVERSKAIEHVMLLFFQVMSLNIGNYCTGS